MEIIAAHDLAHRYGRNVVFTGLSISVTPGQVVAVTGCNGSGKSTLIKILAGLLRPTRGSVRAAKAESDMAERLSIGLVAPYVNLYGELTLRENLQFIGRLRGSGMESSAIAAVSDRVGLLPGKLDQALRTYSTGMVQRARFAAALMCNPEVLLLDEPTIGMDRSGRDMCAKVVRDIQESGGAVIIAGNAQHDIALARDDVCVENFSPRFRLAQ